MDLEALLYKAKEGDREAITQVVMEHQALIRGYLARLAPDPVAADDLAQEVFLAALQSFERIDPRLGIRPYLLAMARNLARSAWRKRVRSREVSGEALFDVLAARCEPETTAAQTDLRIDALRECLGRLAPKAHEIMLRHYRDEQRCDEIAQQMGTATSTVRSTLTRARQALRDCIQPRLERVLA